MSSTASSRRLRVQRTVAATPIAAWNLIADVTRMGEWSPETTGAAWVGGSTGPVVGARFKGTNQMGTKKWVRLFWRDTVAA